MEHISSLVRYRPVVASVLTVIVAVLLTGCTGRGGGWLPPDHVLYSDKASFGFSFKCERSSNSYNTNPKAARLHIELSYTEHGTYTGLDSIPAGGPFSIHGVADEIDPVIESMICTGEYPESDENRLVFLGTYRVTSADPGQFTTCRTEDSICRFEVIVGDNDGNNEPSTGDFFSISLSGPTTVGFSLTGPLVYARAGELGGGNITVD